MCKDMNVPFLGRVPIDPRLARACDEGKNYCATYPDAPGVKALGEIVASTRTLFALHGVVVVPLCSTVSRSGPHIALKPPSEIKTAVNDTDEKKSN